jgi:hypothetical protein
LSQRNKPPENGEKGNTGTRPALPPGFQPLDRTSGRETHDLEKGATDKLLGDDAADEQSNST